MAPTTRNNEKEGTHGFEDLVVEHRVMRTVAKNRVAASAVVAGATWAFGHFHAPFPVTNDVIVLVANGAPHVVAIIRLAYAVMWFTTPFIVSSVLLSFGYIFFVKPDKGSARIALPRYPAVNRRDELFLVVGEVHKARRPQPIERPRWLTIPRRALFTGVGIFGAVGTGKTSCCMYPFAEQILSYRRDDPERRAGGLVLEVKGDFCYRLQEILRRHGREGDYIEISLDCPYRYNPLHNDLEAYALAYGIASLLTNLFGRGKEPFWQQAYTNVVKFIILLHKSVYGYVTLFDVYACAIDPDLLARSIAEGEALFEPGEYLVVSMEDYAKNGELEALDFANDPALNDMRLARTDENERQLKALNVPYSVTGSASDKSTYGDEQRRQQFEAVVRWFHQDWMRIEPKLRTSIVEGISVFLSLFDDNPAVKRVFCPPKECYDERANADHRHGIPLPPFAELVESGAVVALNFPVAANPGLAKAIGTFLKQDFQRAMLGRIPKIERQAERHWREVFFLCDEYQAFATVGESDPSGDEKFFSLSRQAKCIPIIATQSISSLASALPGDTWRTLLQTFRTKIFLALSDDFSTAIASDLCGKDEQLKEQYSIAENSQDARVSFFSGRTTSHRSAITTTKSYDVSRLSVFEPKVFAELKNAQAIVLAYDGLNPLPPTYCYLKPYYLDPNRSYFEQLARGEI